MMNRPAYKESLFPHWMNISIRFRDLDPLQHVNNAIFSTYYEEARIHFIQDVPELAAPMKSGYSFVLANLEIDFIQPVEYPATLLIGSGIQSVGNTSISSFQAIYTSRDKELVSVASAHGVWFDRNEQRPSRLPDLSGREDLLLSSIN